MDNASSYDKFSRAQRTDASEFVPYFISLMSRREEETVLDFGSGPGFVTKNILLPALTSPSAILRGNEPKVKLVAVDISRKMVEYAAENYADPRITYLATDITKEDTLQRKTFDKIFSLFVLHWIHDLREVCQRLYDLLKPNGEIAFYYLSKSSFYSMYEAMSKHPTWGEYLKDWADFVPKSQFSLDPAKDMADLLTSIGFQVQESSVRERVTNFDKVEQFLDECMAVHPFLHRIPEERRALYKVDYFKTYLTVEKQTHWPENCQEGPIITKYDLVLVRAKRPGDF